MVTVHDQIKLIDSESERLKEYLDTLSGNALGQPSPCELWTVADVLGHLAWATDYFVTTISRGVQGNLSPPEGFPPLGSVDLSSFNDFIAQKAIDERLALGRGLVPAFQERSDRLLELLSSFAPEELQQHCYSPMRVRPAQDYIPIRIQELAVHGWDIQSAIEGSARLSPESLPAVQDRFPQWLSGKDLPGFRPSLSQSSPLRYRFEITGPSPVRHDIVAGTGGSSLEPSSGDADVTLVCAGDVIGLIAYGRITIDTALSEGGIQIHGDRQSADELLGWLQRH